MKRELKPNYKIKLDSAICSLQTLIADYKRIRQKQDTMWGVTDDGTYFIMEGYDDLGEQLIELNSRIVQMKKEVDSLKEIVKNEG